jgi:hypothetical protein
MATGIGAHRLLDAIDAVAYLTDARGIIRAIGAASWQRFASENGAPELTAASVIGTSLFASLNGASVRDACRRLHDSVCLGRRRAVTYEFRCDAPDTERRMRMSISLVNRRREAVMALYQSQIVAETPRLPLGLLSIDRRVRDTPRHYGELVVLCSSCHDVVWPVGAPEPDQNWIGIEDHYGRGGTSQVAVSHGICPTCAARIVEPNAIELR